MAEAAVASVLLEPLISMVKAKASSYLLEKYLVMAGMEEQRADLNRQLPAILDIITDAEEQGGRRPGVKTWLEALKAVAYEAIDVFDEFNYEALRREAKKNGHYIKLGMGVFPAYNPIVFRYRMGKKLRTIVQTIQKLVDEMNKFGFTPRRQQAPTHKPWRDTIPDMSEKIVCREEEKKKIVELLLGQDDSKDLMVLPIVGMGGLGKTAFAKLVYKHPDIEKHFALRMWVCVSEDFDIGILAKKIIEMATKKACDLSKDNLPLLMQTLKQELSAKRYFLVLDDVWSEDVDKWEELKSCLQQGGAASAILTTTRNKEVARIMGTVEAHYLQKLGKNALKEIFERRAFSSQEQKLDGLVDLIDKIVEKCAGSPLAAKALGSVLCNKSTIEEWQAILSKSSLCNEETGILPILKLSYDDLPPHMKQCFAFCAVFPKDYEIPVEELIQLWMANDFIPLQQGVHMETIGKRIFDELVWRSFFQDVKQVSYITMITYSSNKHGHCGRILCKIHDLMHDVAQSVMGKECATISMKKLDHRDSFSDSTRHLFLSHLDSSGTHLNDFWKKRSPGIQTLFYCDYVNTHLGQLSKYSALRALKLTKCRSIKPRHWKHLRYLDLSRNYDMVALPEEISTLYNLQTLNLSNCYKLCYLPNGTKYMTALRHLYTDECSEMKYMPPGLGQLTSLQTLTRFPAGTASNNCSNIRELQSLNLGGRLELYHLENVTEADARAANLEAKKELTELLVSWGDVYCDEWPNQVVDQDKKVLEALKPHVGLRVLEVKDCRNIEFSYIDMLQYLVELRLTRCRMCEKLPKLWQLPALRVLELCGMDRLKFICSGDDGNTTSLSFPSLKELQLCALQSLKGWWEVEGRQREQQIFPELVSLTILWCPELATLPEAPKLEELDVRVQQPQMSLSIARHMTSLSKLKLGVHDSNISLPLEQNFADLAGMTKNQNHGASTLTEMVLSGCDFLFPSNPSQPALGLWRYFGVLEILRIYQSDALVYWPEEEFQSLLSLKTLQISSCNQLTGCAPMTRPSASERNQLLPSLQSLEISCCPSLVEIFNLPSSLREIRINGSPQLQTEWEKQDAYQSLQVESLSIWNCGSVGKLLNLPQSLQTLHIGEFPKLEQLSGQLDALETLIIESCGSLKSLESCLGDLRSLKFLNLRRCKSLTSLPNEAGGYSSLQELRISYCPALKPLPISLQQRLDTLPFKELEYAFSREPNKVSGNLRPRVMNPKTWKYAIWRNESSESSEL